MNYPIDVHTYENFLVEELLSNYVPPEDHSEYFTIVTGLRLRVFEGVITNFLLYKKVKIDIRAGLGPKISKLSSLIALDKNQQVNELVGVLHHVRNYILHGDFDFKITEDIYQELSAFLFCFEDHLVMYARDEQKPIDFPGSKALQLKIKITGLLAS